MPGLWKECGFQALRVAPRGAVTAAVGAVMRAASYLRVKVVLVHPGLLPQSSSVFLGFPELCRRADPHLLRMWPRPGDTSGLLRARGCHHLM